MRGLHWYMGGVGIQQLCILVFLAFAIQFHRIILREHLLPPQTLKAVLKLQYTLYIVLAAISVRSLRNTFSSKRVELTRFRSAESSSVSVNTPRVWTQQSLIMKLINTASTVCLC